MRWLNSNSDLPNSTGFITIVNGKRNHTAIPLSYMNQFRTDNVYTLSIREKVSKKVQFSAAMSVAKTSTEPLQESQGSSIQDNQQPLLILPEVSNPEYHRPKGRPPHKRYKSVVKNDRVILSKSNETTAQKTCSYCSGKGYNI
ncbi:unnamed protein product [Rhizophagus irregularis]|uniref:Uncharacterized protein n=1 Tax=Rhizophagus irregularis TaxID=588596 RepID=A0A915YR36_9GLOM|nr:unnamed protein product [Rhizophagus irregularis]